MIDITTLVKDLNIGTEYAEKLEPLLAAFEPQVATVLVAAIKAIRAGEAALGLPTSPDGFAPQAALAVAAHLTPGQPNFAPLAG